MSALSLADLGTLDAPKLDALIETMFLAAYADGEFGDEERAHFTSSVESLTDRRLTGDQLTALMNRMERALKESGREARLAAVRASLGDANARKVALALAIRVVASDGIIRTTERELILEVADALDIDRDEAADLVKELTTSS
jgi:tellurite resistance protein